eukprot:COSAG01_NODE_452_length_16879_cov_474.367223_13_plen_124_part_00
MPTVSLERLDEQNDERIRFTSSLTGIVTSSLAFRVAKTFPLDEASLPSMAAHCFWNRPSSLFRTRPCSNRPFAERNAQEPLVHEDSQARTFDFAHLCANAVAQRNATDQRIAYVAWMILGARV